MSPAKTAARSEAELWRAQQAVAEAALNFVNDYLGCGMGADDTPLTSTGKARLLAMLRAVSFVESRHGTAGANQPARDPIQCGNPRDAWWKELTGQSGTCSRLIRGQGLSAVWANQVAAAAEGSAGFPDAAALGKLAEAKAGHRDPGFSPMHSYLWGAIYLIHRTNTTAGDRTFQCRDLSCSRLVDGAVAYNGGGDPAYRTKIDAALTSGWAGSPRGDRPKRQDRGFIDLARAVAARRQINAAPVCPIAFPGAG
ncbi:hypothetical protein [Methylobacterium planeticum]|uniref:Uncharacterized protein n=1 Tax=Methylobacterium planeticum TaxID=2615211 RepID=A0A6N6MID5_9HYPH|nr:hypothetical protein [Methylobacterium planeticum]KAB1070163.1 hypothetical protein F6X51_23635 [Methylobacterium planeticum]